MLASLLPGLRDVRTPLTVGYLWLIFVWLQWGDLLPADRPAGDGPVARLFDLSALLGSTALVASISFAAYVLGAVVTIPLEGRLAARAGVLLSPIPRALRPGWRTHELAEQDYRDFIHDLEDEFPDVDIKEVRPAGFAILLIDRVMPGDAAGGGDSFGRRRNLTYPSPESLRPRLLASGKTDVYGEYDRLASEAAFRINLCAPLLALSIYGATVGDGVDWRFLAGPIVVIVLFIQGTTRVVQSRTTLMRAAIDGVYKHPLREYFERNSKNGGTRTKRTKLHFDDFDDASADFTDFTPVGAADDILDNGQSGAERSAQRALRRRNR